MSKRDTNRARGRATRLLVFAAAAAGVAALAASDRTPVPGRLSGTPAAAAVQLDLSGHMAPTSAAVATTVTGGSVELSTTASIGLTVDAGSNPLCGLSGLCVRFVTHYDPSAGPPVVREHDIVPGIGDVAALPAWPIDATGDGISDLAVAVSAPLSLTPPGGDRDRPEIKIERVASAPVTFPVKVEAVIDKKGAPGHKVSFGYDTRGSTAPTRFIAKIDLRDRDGVSTTEQKKVDLTITRGPSDTLAMVSETFTPGAGLGESQRTTREITRLTYRGDAGGARVPPTAGVDSTESEGSRRLVLTRDELQPTIVDFLTNDGAANPSITTGTIDRLPTSVDLTIADEEVNGDGEKDKKIDYSAGGEVGLAKVGLSQPVTDKGDPDVPGDDVVHRRDVDIEAHQVPRKVIVKFAAPTPDEDPPKPNAKPGTVSLEASGRTGSVAVRGEDELPIFERARAFRLDLSDVPRALDATFGGGEIKLDAFTTPKPESPDTVRVHDTVRLLEFSGQDTPGEAISVPACASDDCNDGFDVLRDPELSGAIRDDTPDNYALFARIHNLKSARIVSDPDPDPDPSTDTTDVFVDTAPDLGPPGSGCGEFPPPGCDTRTESFRSFEALINKARDDEDPSTPPVTTLRAQLSELLPGTRFTQIKVGEHTKTDPSDDLSTITYTNRAPDTGRPTLTVEADNLDGPDGKNGQSADNLRAVLHLMPSTLFFSTGAGGFPLELCTSAEVMDPAASCNAEGSEVDLDVLLSSDGATEADLLPTTESVDYNFTPLDTSDDDVRPLAGVRIRDFPDRYVIHARMPGVRSVTIDKQSAPVEAEPCKSDDDLTVKLERRHVGGFPPRLRFDSQKEIGGRPCELSLKGVESQFVTLDQIPLSLSLRKFTGEEGETRFSYSASETVGTPGHFGHCPESHAGLRPQPGCTGFQVTQTTNYINPAPDPFLPNKRNTVSVVPMPRTLSVCRSGDTDICSDDAFGTLGDRAGSNIGSLRVTASPRARFQYYDEPNTMSRAHTLADLTTNDFKFQGDSADEGYLAFDTGWRPTAYHEPAPSEAETTRGILKSVGGVPAAGDPEVSEFRFGEGFAADRRILGWPSAEVLFLAEEADITEHVTVNVGQVLCPDGTDALLVRRNPFIPGAGSTVDLNLRTELCNDSGHGPGEP